MPMAIMGHPAPPRPSILGRSFDRCVVDIPYDCPLPSELKIDCKSSHRVRMIPTLIARRSNSRRKLFKSRSKKRFLLFHSNSRAILFLQQSTL
jgi:hypothetical protein